MAVSVGTTQLFSGVLTCIYSSNDCPVARSTKNPVSPALASQSPWSKRNPPTGPIDRNGIRPVRPRLIYQRVEVIVIRFSLEEAPLVVLSAPFRDAVVAGGPVVAHACRGT
jgi:hypothetical protein